MTSVIDGCAQLERRAMLSIEDLEVWSEMDSMECL
jgi:hypothetical protein